MFEKEYRRQIEQIGPGEAQLKAVLERLAAQPERRAHRPWNAGRTVLAAALLCVALIASALAVSPGLRETLAAALGSFGSYAQEPEGGLAESQGIEIRVVSVLTDGNTARIYFEVQDKAGDRLGPYTTMEEWWVNAAEIWPGGGLGMSKCLAYDADSRTGLFLLSLNGDGAPVEDCVLKMKFRGIRPERREISIPFPDVELSGEVLACETLPTGETVLLPGQNGAELESGLLSLSSYGFASDGYLHMLFRVDMDQVDWDQVDWEESKLYPYLDSRELAEAYEALRSGEVSREPALDYARVQRYNGDGAGCLTVFFTRDGGSYYDVRYGVETEDAEDILPGAISGFLVLGERIEGEWELTVPLQTSLPVRTVTLNTEIGGIEAKSLHITALGCTIEGDPHGAAGTLGYPLAVFLADGTVTAAGRSTSSVRYDDYVSDHWSFPETVEPEQVIGVSIGQWYVPLNGDTAGEGYWLSELPK